MAPLWQPLGESSAGVHDPCKLLRASGGHTTGQEVGGHTGEGRGHVFLQCPYFPVWIWTSNESHPFSTTVYSFPHPSHTFHHKSQEVGRQASER